MAEEQLWAWLLLGPFLGALCGVPGCFPPCSEMWCAEDVHQCLQDVFRGSEDRMCQMLLCLGWGMLLQLLKPFKGHGARHPHRLQDPAPPTLHPWCGPKPSRACHRAGTARMGIVAVELGKQQFPVVDKQPSSGQNFEAQKVVTNLACLWPAFPTVLSRVVQAVTVLSDLCAVGSS